MILIPLEKGNKVRHIIARVCCLEAFLCHTSERGNPVKVLFSLSIGTKMRVQGGKTTRLCEIE